MQTRILTPLQTAYKWAFLACLAILPMSHTTALRNLLLVVLLALLLIYAVQQRHELPALVRTARPVPWPLVIWCVFLLLFPLWAVDPQAAWADLRGQWLQSMIAWLLGFGAVWVLGRQGPGLWALAWASFFPLAVHLLLSLLAWMGLLGGDLPMFLSFGETWHRLIAAIDPGQGHALGPFGHLSRFWGVEPMHGNLGYASNQAMVLFSVLLLFSASRGERSKWLTALLAIGLSLLSITVASSRGAFLYAGLIILVAPLIYYLRLVRSARAPDAGGKRSSIVMAFGVATVVSLLMGLTYSVAAHDPRWQTMADKVRLGLMQDDPAHVLCEGLSAEDEKRIRAAFDQRDPAYVDDLIVGLKGQDGGRILLMRVGLDLVMDNPLGLDGSRGAYKKAIEKKCGHEPKETFAHTHQSWLDLSLALGWLGAGLFAALLLFIACAGWRAMRRGTPEQADWGFALLLVASFWFLRGFADSLYREHYLQMQAILMAYLYARAFLLPEKISAHVDGR